MKKWYRIGICLVLTVCLLLLPACKIEQPPQTDDPQQSTGQSEENDLSQKGENLGTQVGGANNTSQQEEKNDLPETLEFYWKNAFIELEDWENVSLFKGKLLTYEDYKMYGDGILAQHNASYPKEFFDDHSLILVELSSAHALLTGRTMWEVKDVSYENGVLRCAVTQYYDTLGFVVSPSTDGDGMPTLRFWACFIEINTVLPDGSEIILDFTDEFLDSEKFDEKYAVFREKSIK